MDTPLPMRHGFHRLSPARSTGLSLLLLPLESFYVAGTANRLSTLFSLLSEAFSRRLYFLLHIHIQMSRKKLQPSPKIISIFLIFFRRTYFYGQISIRVGLGEVGSGASSLLFTANTTISRHLLQTNKCASIPGCKMIWSLGVRCPSANAARFSISGHSSDNLSPLLRLIRYSPNNTSLHSYIQFTCELFHLTPTKQDLNWRVQLSFRYSSMEQEGFSFMLSMHSLTAASLNPYALERLVIIESCNFLCILLISRDSVD